MYAEHEENARYTFIEIEVKINSNFINYSQSKSVKKTVFFKKTIQNCTQFLLTGSHNFIKVYHKKMAWVKRKFFVKNDRLKNSKRRDPE